MFISLSDCHGDWLVVFEDEDVAPRRICCWGIREISGKHKVVPVVHSKGGKLVDANSIGEIATISDLNAKMKAPKRSTKRKPKRRREPVYEKPPSDPVPDFEDDDLEDDFVDAPE